jgi:hypothetical protein
MTFMDVLKPKPIVVEKSMSIVKEDYTSKPLYRELENALERMSGLSAPVPTIMQVVDKAIETKQKSDVKLPKETKDKIKRDIKNFEEQLKLIDETGEQKVFKNRIKTLEKIVNRLTKLQSRYQELLEIDTKITDEKGKKLKITELNKPQREKASDLLDTNVEAEKEFDETTKPLYDELEQLEGARGKEAEERIEELEEKIKQASKVRDEAKKDDPITEFFKIKTAMREAFTGTFNYSPKFPDEKLGTRGQSRKPRNEVDGEYDETFTAGIENYKKRLEAYDKLDTLTTSKKDKLQAKTKLQSKIDSLKRQQKTGRAEKELLITSQIRPRDVKNTLIRAIRELDLPSFSDEIIGKLTPKLKERSKKVERELTNQEEALIQTIRELNADEISSSTQTRLKVNNILNNKFLYNLTLNVSGERNNIHPTVIQMLKEGDTFNTLTRRLKDINPKLKSATTSEIKRLMQRLRTAKTNVSQIARQVNAKEYPKDIEYKDLLALNNESDLSKLLNKYTSINATWQNLSEKFFLREGEDEEGLEGWSDRKVIADFDRTFAELLQEAPDDTHDKDEHIKKGYKKLVKSMEKLFKESKFYFNASVKLTEAFMEAKGFRYQIPESAEWSGLLSEGQRDTDLDLAGIKQSIRETQQDIVSQFEKMKTFIPEYDDLLEEMSREGIETPMQEQFAQETARLDEERKKKLSEELRAKEEAMESDPYKTIYERDSEGRIKTRVNPKTGEKEPIPTSSPKQMQALRDLAERKRREQEDV